MYETRVCLCVCVRNTYIQAPELIIFIRSAGKIRVGTSAVRLVEGGEGVRVGGERDGECEKESDDDDDRMY